MTENTSRSQEENQGSWLRSFALMILFTVSAILVWRWLKQWEEESAKGEPSPERRLPTPMTPYQPRTIAAREPARPTSAPVPRPAETAPPSPDPLTEIDGIGPRVQKILYDGGIATFRQLAQSDPEELKKLLRQANLPMINPSTWPEQAQQKAAGR